MPFTSFGQRMVMDAAFGRVEAPGTFHIAALLSLPAQKDVSGSALNEPSGSGYGRISISNNLTTWDVTTNDGLKSSKSALLFPVPTASWGSIRGLALCTSSSGGDVVVWDSLTEAVETEAGVAPEIPPGGVSMHGVSSLEVLVEGF